MVKIAVDLQRALKRRAAEGSGGAATPRVIARGEGWSVADVICTSGADDRPFEEQHTHYSVAIVLAGTFQLRSSCGDALMVPGSLMLGNEGQCFECGHEHAAGDRCVSFFFDREYFERLAVDAGARVRPDFPVSHVPPVREVAPLVAAAGAGIAAAGAIVPWDELAVRVAARAVTLARDMSRPSTPAPLNAAARVTRVVRAIDRAPDSAHTLASLAREAGLSAFHFLRTFEHVVGVTPHQYVRRARLRHAALRMTTEPERVLDIALDAGFGDVSNFNRAFRAEFGMTPTTLRRRSRADA